MPRNGELSGNTAKNSSAKSIYYKNIFLRAATIHDAANFSPRF
ncbi:hypothetical protein RVIR1_09570 [Candidatus Rickettsiella viridis]|uniref:Uncharacterized protein n=1 Tax=Candidatus Rickettsiella viridis TaxID=676208 RepID=A0A2Z5UWI5_9COXI|nr:hypothetical protein RVIR1_09570 [Candidatus Rickettsiella viridis]